MFMEVFLASSREFPNSKFISRWLTRHSMMTV